MDAYSWAVFLGVAVLTLIYHQARNYRETIMFLATFLAGAAAIMQLHAAAVQYREDLKHKKISVAFSYFDKWNTSMRPSAKAVSNLMNEIGGKSPEQADKVLADADKRRNLLAVFDFFEDAGLAVSLGYADEPALCQYFSQPAVQFFTTARPWLEYWRNKNQLKGAYENYEKLSGRWGNGCPSGA